MRTFNVGFIGAGFIGKVQLSQLYRLKSKVNIAALAEKDVELGKETAREFGIEKVTDDYRELLNDPDIHVIHNCTPNQLHYKINKEALLAGKHVFSEKPLALTAAEGAELAKIAEEKGLEAGVNFCYRFYPVVQHAAAMIKNNDIGEIFTILGNFLQDWLLFQTDYNWRLECSAAGDSYILADLGSHWCDLVQFVTGLKIVEVMADTRTIYPVRKKPKGQVDTFARQSNVETEDVKCELDDFGALLIKFENGARGVFSTSSLCAGRKVSIDLQIYGSKKSLCWSHEKPNEILIGSRDGANEIFMESPLFQHESTRHFALLPTGHPMGYHDAEFNLFSEFYKAVETNAAKGNSVRAYPTFNDAAQELRIVEAAIKSSKEGKWMKVEG